ncbi:MAG: heme exporter protein CcmB [Gammaproteobacteria bacterium]|nr:heme exporter protein CcmB [Gammaproteobacteria bacterium]NNF60450.1 heme exporter protein CcmB [Gammaproteobacteria bacterium]
MTEVLRAIIAQWQSDFRVALRRWGELANPVIFFVAVTLLFPLSLSPDAALLGRIAPGIIWVAALFAVLLGQESLFRPDLADGTLEQMAISRQPLMTLVFGKLLAHWTLSALPLVLLSPMLAIALAMPTAGIPTMMLSLLLGTPTLVVISAIAAALTVGLSRGGLLLSILVVPLIVPVLIFGARATDLAAFGEEPGGVLYLLGAILALALTLGPLAVAAALRISLD